MNRVLHLLRTVKTWLTGWVRRMAYDPSKVYYVTTATIDKILDEDTFSHTESSGIPPSPSTSTQTTGHSLGVSVWVEGQYSIDGNNYYPLGTAIYGAVDGGTSLRQSVYCYGYADATTVYFYVENGFTSNKTFDVRYALEAMS